MKKKVQENLNKFPEVDLEGLKDIFSDLIFPQGGTTVSIVLRYGDVMTSKGLYTPTAPDGTPPQAGMSGGHQTLFDRPYTILHVGSDSDRGLNVGDLVLTSPLMQVRYVMARRGYILKVVQDYDIVFAVKSIDEYQASNIDNIDSNLPSAKEASNLIA